MNLTKLLLVITILSIIPGQLLRLSFLPSSALTLTDIFVFVTVVVAVPNFLASKKSLILDARTVIPAVVFSLVAASSTILALNSFTQKEVLVSSLFLARFFIYFLISTVTANLVKPKEVENWLKLFLLISFVFLTLGFIQLVIFPDLTFLTPFGWDPHQRRIVSTFLDPNFAGMFLCFAFSFSLGFFQKQKKPIYLLISVLFFLGIMLTFSRSSYLALLAVLFTIGLLKSPKLLIIFLAFFLFAVLSSPQIRSRIAGAATLDETSQARIESWQKAIKIFSENPVFGVGFNTYRYAQNKYGFFSFDDPSGGHSGAGTDSSILLIAATTGIIGLAAYIYLLFAIFLKLAKKAGNEIPHLAALAIFFGLLIHSQFVNSLFFPQIMLPFWFVIGLISSYDS